MRTSTKLFMGAFALAACTVTSLADERSTIAGRIVDGFGKPLENALVIVYSAGVKTGYSRFCPTCYRDCGKKTLTGADGRYAISGLDPELKFTLLAAKDWYMATWINKVNPADGPISDVRLNPQTDANNASRIVRGRVVDMHGDPLKFAVVNGEVAEYKTDDGHQQSSEVSSRNVTLANDKGEFDFVDDDTHIVEMTFLIAAPGIAPRHFTAPVGSDRKTIVVTEGATIKGLLVFNGKPVASAELALDPHASSPGQAFAEVRIGTDEDGGFVISNVPPGNVWRLTPTMDSLAARGIGADAVTFQTTSDGQTVNLGDVRLKAAHTLSGKVILSDGKPIPAGTRLQIGHARDSQVAKISSDGSFRFQGLPDGIYQVVVAVWGYRISNESVIDNHVELFVDADVNDLIIRMEPISRGGGTP
jgi:protocatechuate 3,4-dioxygenase beta subunit